MTVPPDMPSPNHQEDRQALTAFVVDNRDLERLESLLSQFNIFEAIGVARQELRHSDFLAFLLDPHQPHGLGDAFARRLLQRALIDAGAGVSTVSPIDLDIWSLGHLVVLREWRHVDILLLAPDHHLAVIIENKIGSGEHADQLDRYLKAVAQQYHGWTVVPLFLTPDGTAPSDESYLPVDYGIVCQVVEDLAESRRPSLDPAVHALITHYARMLRRHVVADSEIADLCRRIYQRHRRALDVIFEHRPDEQAAMRDFLVDLVTSTEGLVLDDSPKKWVRFGVQEWDSPALNVGEGWTSSCRMLLFRFQNDPQRFELGLFVGPGPQQVRDCLIAAARDAGAPLSVMEPQGRFVPLLMRQFLQPHEFETYDREELQARVRTYWSQFISQELPAIKEALNIPELVEQLPPLVDPPLLAHEEA